MNYGYSPVAREVSTSASLSFGQWLLVVLVAGLVAAAVTLIAMTFIARADPGRTAPNATPTLPDDDFTPPPAMNENSFPPDGHPMVWCAIPGKYYLRATADADWELVGNTPGEVPFPAEGPGEAWLAIKGDVTDSAMAALADLGSHPALVYVSVGRCDALTIDGFAHVAKLRHVREFVVASLPQMTDEWFASIGQLKLRRLGVFDCQGVAGSGLQHIAGMDSLREAEFGFTPLTDEAVPHLSKMTFLDHLHIGYTSISTDGVDALRTALPTTRVEGP